MLFLFVFSFHVVVSPEVFESVFGRLSGDFVVRPYFESCADQVLPQEQMPLLCKAGSVQKDFLNKDLS